MLSLVGVDRFEARTVVGRFVGMLSLLTTLISKSTHHRSPINSIEVLEQRGTPIF